MLHATQIRFNSPHMACCFWLESLLMDSPLPGKLFILYLPGSILLILKDSIQVNLSLASSSLPNYARCHSLNPPTLCYNGVLIHKTRGSLRPGLRLNSWYNICDQHDCPKTRISQPGFPAPGSQLAGRGWRASLAKEKAPPDTCGGFWWHR